MDSNVKSDQGLTAHWTAPCLNVSCFCDALKVCRVMSHTLTSELYDHTIVFIYLFDGVIVFFKTRVATINLNLLTCVVPLSIKAPCRERSQKWAAYFLYCWNISFYVFVSSADNIFSSGIQNFTTKLILWQWHPIKSMCVIDGNRWLT